MSERPPDDSIEKELERTLAEDLDGVSPRRNLWPGIAAEIDVQPPRSWRRWLIPALGSAAAVALIVVVLPAVLQQVRLPGGLGSAPVATGTPPPSAMRAGSELFLASGCAACHTIDSVPQARGQLGPNLSRVGAKGADYIRESIVSPNAVIAAACPGGPCPSGLMPNFGLILTQDEVDAIVAFLLEQQ